MTVIRYAKRVGYNGRKWDVWQVVETIKDGGLRVESWGSQVLTNLSSKDAKDAVARLNSELK